MATMSYRPRKDGELSAPEAEYERILNLALGAPFSTPLSSLFVVTRVTTVYTRDFHERQRRGWIPVFAHSHFTSSASLDFLNRIRCFGLWIANSPKYAQTLPAVLVGEPVVPEKKILW
jgi:hypothetical protein